jgi:hypothetical protein
MHHHLSLLPLPRSATMTMTTMTTSTSTSTIIIILIILIIIIIIIITTIGNVIIIITTTTYFYDVLCVACCYSCASAPKSIFTQRVLPSLPLSTYPRTMRVADELQSGVQARRRVLEGWQVYV